jgi:type IV pilus assembly protein PilW
MTIHRHNQRGLSLISLMIALLIGTFLLAGLFAVWFQTRTTFKTQNQMAQVQDNQRMALIILANAVQTAGYYPAAANYTTTPPAPLYQASTVFPGTSPFTVTGQAIYGTHSTTNATNDMLELRFMTDMSNTTNDNTLDCLGQADTAQTLVVETFQLDASNNLTCIVTVNGQASKGTIVPNVKGLEVYYGVSTTEDNSVTEYLTADQVTADSMWAYVQSVNLQLTFANPLYGQSGVPGQTSTLPVVSRIVSLTQTAK